jgi:catechol 2,3-dioxygenase-like lactoylglutathione lyase family enzyme
MTLRAIGILCLGVLAMADPGHAAPAEPAGHITGIGGVFIKAKDPKALAAWYRDVLGMPLQPWGGAALHYDAPGHPPAAAWSAFPASSSYFAPSTTPFMINYAVDDANGRFAWVLDPEGNKVELWEPKRTTTP